VFQRDPDDVRNMSPLTPNRRASGRSSRTRDDTHIRVSPDAMDDDQPCFCLTSDRCCRPSSMVRQMQCSSMILPILDPRHLRGHGACQVIVTMIRILSSLAYRTTCRRRRKADPATTRSPTLSSLNSVVSFGKTPRTARKQTRHQYSTRCKRCDESLAMDARS